MASLTERYVHAVTHALPADRRAGVAEGIEQAVARKVRKLRGKDATLSEEDAEYAAVLALGDPARHLPRATDRRLLLVPPRVFGTVLVVTVVLVMLGVGLNRLVVGIGDSQSTEEIAANMLWIMVRSGFRVVAILAFLWFLFEIVAQVRHARALRGSSWRPEDLPDE